MESSSHSIQLKVKKVCYEKQNSEIVIFIFKIETKRTVLHPKKRENRPYHGPPYPTGPLYTKTTSGPLYTKTTAGPPLRPPINPVITHAGTKVSLFHLCQLKISVFVISLGFCKYF